VTIDHAAVLLGASTVTAAELEAIEAVKAADAPAEDKWKTR
jgi:hypothetical protein